MDQRTLLIIAAVAAVIGLLVFAMATPPLTSTAPGPGSTPPGTTAPPAP